MFGSGSFTLQATYSENSVVATLCAGGGAGVVFLFNTSKRRAPVMAEVEESVPCSPTQSSEQRARLLPIQLVAQMLPRRLVASLCSLAVLGPTDLHQAKVHKRGFPSGGSFR